MCTLDERPSVFNKSTFTAEEMMRKDYDLKGSVEKYLWS
jgi:hypothetical protein